ncbi:MAG TPA: hypothetical protein VF865_13270, partial [Acidobacteriaceae bacterium]
MASDLGSVSYVLQKITKMFDVMSQRHTRIIFSLIFDLKKPGVPKPLQFPDDRLNRDDAGIERRTCVPLSIVCLAKAIRMLTWRQRAKILKMHVPDVRGHFLECTKRIITDKNRSGSIVGKPER